MRSVKLSDGTLIEGCSINTACDNIEIIRETANEAASYLDIVTPENTGVIIVYEDGEVDEVASGLELESDIFIKKEYGGYCIHFHLHYKSEMERIKDEIAELQEYIIEGGDI